MKNSFREARAARAHKKLMSQTRLRWWVNAAFAIAAAAGCFYLAGVRQHPIIIVIGLGFLAMGIGFIRNAIRRPKA
jgi:hypothetical protein